MKRSDILATLLALFIVLGWYILDPEGANEFLYNERPAKEQGDTTEVAPGDPTPERVLIYLSEIGVEHPEIVTAQAVVETGWFKCTDCSMQFNNLFGFRVNGEYLQFDDWKQSCDYYLSWQQSRYIGGDYYNFLSVVGYALDSLYEEKVRNVASQISTETHP